MEKCTRAVIITGGSMFDYDYIRGFLQPGDFIIAADSGYKHALALGLRPQVLLGDFDSLDHLPQDIPIERHPAQKDCTDTQLALDWARKRGHKHFLLLGAIGTRMDHSLANINLLAQMLDAGETGQMVDEHNEIFITDSELTIYGKKGDILSLIPLTTCTGVTTENLYYPLQGATLEAHSGLGVSNVFTASCVRVRLSSGKLLVMRCRD